MQRLTKRLQREKGSERHLICWLGYIVDICSGQPDRYEPDKITLPELLAKIQNENHIKPFDETRKYIEKIKKYISNLEVSLNKAEYEIKMIKGGKES